MKLIQVDNPKLPLELAVGELWDSRWREVVRRSSETVAFWAAERGAEVMKNASAFVRWLVLRAEIVAKRSAIENLGVSCLTDAEALEAAANALESRQVAIRQAVLNALPLRQFYERNETPSFDHLHLADLPKDIGLLFITPAMLATAIKEAKPEGRSLSAAELRKQASALRAELDQMETEFATLSNTPGRKTADVSDLWVLQYVLLRLANARAIAACDARGCAITDPDELKALQVLGIVNFVSNKNAFDPGSRPVDFSIFWNE